MRKYTYDRWSGGKRTVEALEVRFEPSGHVSFWNDSILVLAERTEQVNNLTELPEWMECPGCGEDIYLDPQYGWRNGGGYTCNGWGTHGDCVAAKKLAEDANG